MNYTERNSKYRNIINNSLDEALSVPFVPYKLAEAMRYSVKAGGKRIRACLTLGVCDMLRGNRKMAIRLACGIEMIHTYSLIHDDLPCMDNDDMRRGKPSNHKVFGEATALLAGDGLLTYAFEYMLDAGLGFNSLNYYRAVAEISKRAGVCGMVAGQIADLEAEGSGECSARKLEYIHLHKTADMLCASVLAGAYCAAYTESQLRALSGYAEKLGMLFQITDDILDYTGDAELMGKTLGKDKSQHKLTYVSLMGVDNARSTAAATAKEADREIINVFGTDCGYLRDTIYYVLNRSN